MDSDPSLAAVTAVVAGRSPRWDGVETEACANLLIAHGLAGLAFADACRTGESREASPLPSDLSARIRPHYYRVALRSTLLLESAARAVSALRDAGVPSILFKGAALYRSGVYGESGARFMEDVDLLVRPHDADRAVTTLQGVGFDLWGQWDTSKREWLSSVSLSDASSTISCDLDLHWGTRYTRLRHEKLETDDPLWEGADMERGLPQTEPHFVLLAEHFAKHLRVVAHVRGLADLARIAPAIRDPELLRHQARQRGSLPGLRAVLALLRDSFGVALPPSVEERLDVVPLRSRLRRRLALERLLGEPNRETGRVEGLCSSSPASRRISALSNATLRASESAGTTITAGRCRWRCRKLSGSTSTSRSWPMAKPIAGTSPPPRSAISRS